MIEPEEIPSEPFPLVEGGFRTLIVDPPWQYSDGLPGPGRGANKHYKTMKIDEIMDLPVGSIAAPNAHLYLWCTNGFHAVADTIARRWGFEPKTLITWCKTTANGDPQLGLGWYFRGTTEHVIFATRRGARPQRLLVRNLPTHFFATRRAHSVKPDAFYGIVESASYGPMVELFARKAWPGIVGWGHEYVEMSRE